MTFVSQLKPELWMRLAQILHPLLFSPTTIISITPGTLQSVSSTIFPPKTGKVDRLHHEPCAPKRKADPKPNGIPWALLGDKNISRDKCAAIPEPGQ